MGDLTDPTSWPDPGGAARRPTWGERVAAAVGELGPLCAGLDPSAEILSAWDLPDDAAGLWRFCELSVPALAGVVPVVKFQVAFFERHGSAGMAALEEGVAAARGAGLIVICDAKRGDVGSTVQGYADAWFAGPLAGDAVTASPYLGVGALAPMIESARRTGKGLIVVAASSNPEGRVLQEAVTAGGRPVEEEVLHQIAEANAEEGAAVGSVGAVVGATRSGGAFALSSVGGILLAPGVGAQGAGADQVRVLFAGCHPGTVLPSSSRGLLVAGPGGLREAASRAVESMGSALG